jgi:hypothetical protein
MIAAQKGAIQAKAAGRQLCVRPMAVARPSLGRNAHQSRTGVKSGVAAVGMTPTDLFQRNPVRGRAGGPLEGGWEGLRQAAG